MPIVLDRLFIHLILISILSICSCSEEIVVAEQGIASFYHDKFEEKKQPAALLFNKISLQLQAKLKL
jgi:hypothetical protein